MNKSISAFRFPRALLAAVTALALAAPYAAAFGCGGGGCCGPDRTAKSMPPQGAMTQHMQHHGMPEQVPSQHHPSVTEQHSTPICPMMTACGTVSVALVFDTRSTAPGESSVERVTVRSSNAYRGRFLVPLTPPPRI